MNYRSKFAGIGSYLPPRVVTNEDLQEYMETSDEWIVQRTGIKERRWVDAKTSTSDLALQASLSAIEDAKMKKEDIDMILFATISPDHEFPGTACFLQAKLGLAGIPAIDVRQACSGFLYAMSIADLYIRSGQYKNILIVGSEVHSKGLDLTTRGRDLGVLFGDGAGAAILTRCEVNDPKKDSHILSTHIYADGQFADLLWAAAPGSGLGTPSRLTKEHLDEGLHFPQMQGKKVFVHAVKRMCEVIIEAVTKNGYTLDQVDQFVVHQANLRINSMVAEKLGIPAEKVFNTIEKYGNTTAATIPIGLNDAVKAGAVKPGSLVCSASFGGGFTWAAALYRW